MTMQSDILAAMVHRSGIVPWLCSEISHRLGGTDTNNAIGNYMQTLLADGLVCTVPLPLNGGAVAWQLTPKGFSSVRKPKTRIKAAEPKPMCGGPLDVLKIMADEKCSHQDAYRLSIMRTDPAYHPGLRIPFHAPKQGGMDQKIDDRRAKVRVIVLKELQSGNVSASGIRDIANISWHSARYALESLVHDGMAALMKTSNGDIYRITDKGRA